MAITKAKKKDILSKLNDATQKDSVVFVNFHGVSVDEIQEVRNKLREENVSYFVARKTLMRKAFSEAGIEGEMPELEGEAAIAYGDDYIIPAREIQSFHKKFGDSFSILGGVFDGKFMSKAEMEEVAEIPPHDTLKGMFVNVINSPIQGFVATLQAYADKQEA